MAKFRDIPLTAVNLVKQMSTNIVTREPKGLEEGAAGGEDAKIPIEDHEWIANGIDNGLRKRETVLSINKGGGFRRKRTEHANLSPRLERGQGSVNFPK
jgi:hypothetical protein